MVAFNPLQYRNLVSHEGAGVVARKWQDWNADAVFVDDTGGYGAGWIDALTQLGRKPVGVGFAMSATNPRYYNKRTEMYFDCCAVDTQGRSVAGVSGVGGGFDADDVFVQGRSDVAGAEGDGKAAARVQPGSFADGLGLTFAYPVAPKVEREGLRPMIQAEHDPYASMRSATAQQLQSGYDPYGSMRGAR